MLPAQNPIDSGWGPNLADGTTNGRVVLTKPYEGPEKERVRILLPLIPTPAHTGLHRLN